MTQCKNDVILVIVKKLTKVTHFIPISMKDGSLVLARKFVQEIFQLHGIPKTIIPNKDTQMTSQFWITLNSTMGTHLNFGITYHPEIDGKTERVN